MGNWISGWIMDKWGSNRRLYVLLPTWAGLTAIPIYAIGLSVSTLWIAVLFIFLGTILTFSYSTPIYAAVQHLVRQGLRSTGIASYLFINNSIGIGIGVVLLVFLSGIGRGSCREGVGEY